MPIVRGGMLNTISINIVMAGGNFPWLKVSYDMVVHGKHAQTPLRTHGHIKLLWNTHITPLGTHTHTVPLRTHTHTHIKIHA